MSLPSSTVCWRSMPILSEKSNLWYTQIHLQKTRLLRTKGLREISLQCGLTKVVYRSVPTSSRNQSEQRRHGIRLYIVLFLHQTATRKRQISR